MTACGSSPIGDARPGARVSGGGVWLVRAVAVVGWVLLGAASAQSLSRVDARLSVDSVRIGERFTVSVVAEHGGAGTVSFPPADAGPAVFGNLEVLERTGPRRRTVGGTQIDSVAYTVAAFALDSVRVPALPVRVAAGGDTSTARTPARPARIVSVVGPDAEGLHGVAPPAPFPRPWGPWIVLGLLAAGLLAGAAYLWWRRRQGDEASPSAAPAADRPPYEAAAARIRRLEASDRSDPDAVESFYVELARVLRVYLARAREIAALECTTREVIRTLERRLDVPEEAVPRVRAVLEVSDLVKFADARPAAEDHEKALREARAALEALEASSATPPEAVDGVASAAAPSAESEPGARSDRAR